jgi:hypothetical protein
VLDCLRPLVARPDALRAIARRVPWLSAAIVDAAKAGRANHSGVKVGGRQADNSKKRACSSHPGPCRAAVLVPRRHD